MPSLKTLAQSLLTRVNQRKTAAYLVDLSGGNVTEDGALAFQYWPESISDTKATNYQQKEIPGGSLPLYQWINGGERLITFTAIFTTDVDLLSSQASDPNGFLEGGGNKVVDRLKASGVQSRNADIRAAVAWLRQYMLPKYSAETTSSGGRPLTTAPPTLKLVLPNSGIGLAGGDTVNIHSVKVKMTQCDVNFEAFFPNGLPRIATVSLAFAQIPQSGGEINFPSANKMGEEVAGGETAKVIGYSFKPKKS